MSINNHFYNELGERWYTAYDDPVAFLRQEAKVKAPWVIERIQKKFPNKKSTKVLDVGCGGGFLSNRLAEEHFRVHGIDLSLESLEVAKRHDRTKSVSYIYGNAYALPFADGFFDVVTAMDFLEHVEQPDIAVAEISRVLKPKGLFFFHTFNRNFLSYLIVIKGLEWVVKNTPKDMHVLHVLNLFLKPREVRKICEDSGLQVEELTGIRPCFSKFNFFDLVHRQVPEDFCFTLTRSLKLSYMGLAVKTRRRKLPPL
jgi:2-polyprenyl-6-hydroxyphenyl methylase / 3-demethylubiquinone-9 3-methyltransferase